MRAEMTVGLDLKKLENLRIYNGYEYDKKTRRSSLEFPSSPEENHESDASQYEPATSKGKVHSKQKCGRPANPVPRHKRDSHIKAEYKRRDKIQKGFDALLTMVPELSGVSERESKAKMLFKTADYCRRIKSECGSTQTELTALRQELAALGTEIQEYIELQDKLPCHGIETGRKQEDVSMDTLFDQYVQEETKKNWKFWIFGFFMRPLYDSYKQTTSGKQNSQEFSTSVLDWVQNNLSLTSLRKGFLDVLRKISTQTGIMTKPETLEQEARSRITDHCVSTSTIKTEAPLPLTPPLTPRVPTPAPGSSTSQTPVVTPTPTPPRTPNLSRRSSKREIIRSRESRSRSNSPSQEEMKAKRRSNYRSRSGRRSGCEDEISVKMEYTTAAESQNMPLLSQLLTSPQTEITTQFNAVAMATSSQAVPMSATSVSPARESIVNVPSSASSADAVHSSGDQLIGSLFESLISALKYQQKNGKPARATKIESTEMSFPQSEVNTVSNMQKASSSHFTEAVSSHMDRNSVCSTLPTNAFIPLNISGIISNGSLVQGNRSEKPGFPEYRTSVQSDSLAVPPIPITSSFHGLASDILTDSHVIVSDVPKISDNMDQLLTSMLVSASENSVCMNNETVTVDEGPVSMNIEPLPVGAGLVSMNYEPVAMETPVTCSAPVMVPLPNGLMSTDEDSLTELLGIDVMDVNSVLTFFSDGKLSDS